MCASIMESDGARTPDEEPPYRKARRSDANKAVSTTKNARIRSKRTRRPSKRKRVRSSSTSSSSSSSSEMSNTSRRKKHKKGSSWTTKEVLDLVNTLQKES
ncbi:hypothetical protein HW555_009289, partial [Spodoptera exigua]